MFHPTNFWRTLTGEEDGWMYLYSIVYRGILLLNFFCDMSRDVGGENGMNQVKPGLNILARLAETRTMEITAFMPSRYLLHLFVLQKIPCNNGITLLLKQINRIL